MPLLNEQLPDDITNAFHALATQVTEPNDAAALKEFWFRQGAEWKAQQQLELAAVGPSKFEDAPDKMLLVAFARTESLWHTKTRLEHLLLIAAEDQAHSLALRLKESGSYGAFLQELKQFIDNIDQDNKAGLNEAEATPEVLRVFDRMVNGDGLVLALMSEEPHVWARKLLEKHLTPKATA